MIRKKVRAGPSFISVAKDVVGSLKGYSGKFEIRRKFLCSWSMKRELQILRKVVQELLKIPKALMERLTI